MFHLIRHNSFEIKVKKREEIRRKVKTSKQTAYEIKTQPYTSSSVRLYKIVFDDVRVQNFQYSFELFCIMFRFHSVLMRKL